jgi:O2-independent ubiquinone biosynthesis accessory factor UbiT
MEQPAFTFPKPIGTLVSLLPTFPPSIAFTGVLNLALGRIIPKQYLIPLHGKQIVIRVKDLGLNLYFMIDADRFTPTRFGKVPDLSSFSAAA